MEFRIQLVGMMSRLYIIVLCISLLLSPIYAEKNRVLYRSGHNIFTQHNASELIQLAEFLGRSNFTKKDKKALQAWSIDDFKSAPVQGRKFYQNLSNTIIPKIKLAKSGIYRAELYLNFVDLFAKHPEYKQSSNNFLAMVDRYNPPVKEAMQIRQIRHNMVLQQMQMNQMLFNQNMRQAQKSSDMMVKSIQDQSRRQSITIPGGRILSETGDKIYAEDYKGQNFNLSK